jgi:putative ABC transport system permease protein
MSQTAHIISTSINQAFQELRANKLRTFLSLLGITIGIFCIIAVLTVLNSMEDNIQKEMSTLGSDMLYVERWPWTDEGGQYKWWEYLRRPSVTVSAMKAVQNNVPDAAYTTLFLPIEGITVKYYDQELSNISAYAVMPNFDKVKNIDIRIGRYLSVSELGGGATTVVLGSALYDNLFSGHVSPVGKSITLLGKKFTVVGVMKKLGQDIAGFDYDNSLIIPYNAAATVIDVRSLQYDPSLVIKARDKNRIDEMKYEAEGVLRTARKIKPGQPNDFAINQLSQIAKQLEALFSFINTVGSFIGVLSLIVGAFGIANIMFVTVKERTKIIGLKKAIGARSRSILTEFLVEAIVLCLIGGLIGIFIVLMLSLGLTYGADFHVTLSFKNFAIGILVSCLVGVLAGIIPAIAAARLNPVVAIRST